MDRRARWAALVVVATTAAVLWPALANQFVGLDDDVYITANPLIESFSAENLKAILLRPYAEFYHPVTLLSLALDRWLWEFNPFGYHLTDLVLHLLNAALVFWLCRRLVLVALRTQNSKLETRNSKLETQNRNAPSAPDAENVARIAALVTSALFALHPLHVESVAWAAQRKDLLCSFFYLLAFAFYVRHAEQAAESQPGRLFYRLSLAAFLLALLSKSMAVTLPLALVLVDYYPFGRLRARPRRAMPADEREVWLEKLPFFGLALAIAVATLAAQRMGGALRTGGEIPWSLRPWFVIYGYAFYVWKAVVPADLTVLYPIADVRPIHLLPWLCLAALAGISAGAWLLRRRWPVIGAAWLYYIVTLAPVCGLLSFGAQVVADRYSYLPLLGPFLAVGVAVGHLNRLSDRGAGPSLRSFFAGVTALGLFALALGTSQQVSTWQDGESLWRHHLDIFPTNARAHFNLGCYYHSHRRTGAAMQQYQECLALRPNDFEANTNLGSLILALGDAEKASGQRQALFRAAADHFRRALQSRPDLAGAHNNLGMALIRLDLLDQATEEFKRAVTLDGNYAGALANLAEAYGRSGKNNLAIRYYEQALAREPRLVQVHENLGLAYLAAGQTAKARREFDRTLSLRRRSPRSLVELGRLDAAQGHLVAALERFSRAARYRPGDGTIQMAMAKVFWEQNLPGLAESCLRQAVETAPTLIEAYLELARLLEQQQRYSEALELLTEAWVNLQYSEAPVSESLNEALRRMDRMVKALGLPP